MYTLGFDIGSSSVKVSLLEAESGKAKASAFYPKKEMTIIAEQVGWAEQKPEDWWNYIKLALAEVLDTAKVDKNEIKAIGMSYQMHGLVTLDKNGEVIRPSIIWCDSRAVTYGNKAFVEMGEEKCLSCMLNSPGNFTASKLKWVKENEPELFTKIYKIMLPGDYIAYKLTGEMTTTVSGLSEGIMWDFKQENVAKQLLDYYDIPVGFIPKIVKTFGIQGRVSEKTAQELGLSTGTAVSYRAGDQPNNAFSLNVLNPGEVAATGGTSGVVYGISSQLKYDPKSRVNTFAHVNHANDNKRLGVLLCINGTGILNSWLSKNVAEGMSYPEMNDLAASVPAGAEGLMMYPFGNGAERVLNNTNPGSSLKGLNFNTHTKAHVLRAAQEGIAFSFKYGMDIMQQAGIETSVIRAGKANMFLSHLFRQTLANVANAKIELYDTDGSLGAARGAALGAAIYKSADETFASLNKLMTIEPDGDKNKVQAIYNEWLKGVGGENSSS